MLDSFSIFASFGFQEDIPLRNRVAVESYDECIEIFTGRLALTLAMTVEAYLVDTSEANAETEKYFAGEGDCDLEFKIESNANGYLNT